MRRFFAWLASFWRPRLAASPEPLPEPMWSFEPVTWVADPKDKLQEELLRLQIREAQLRIEDRFPPPVVTSHEDVARWHEEERAALIAMVDERFIVSYGRVTERPVKKKGRAK